MSLVDLTFLNISSVWFIFRSLTLHTIVTIALYHVIRKARQFYQLYQAMERIPGPRFMYNILWGNLYFLNANKQADIVTRFFDSMNGLFKVYAQYSIIRLWFSYRPTVFIYKAEAAEKVFSSTTNINKSVEYNFLKQWVGTGLLTSGSQKWHIRRKMLTPAFHFNILQGFLAPMNEQADVLVKVIQSQLGEDRSVTLNSIPLLTRCTMDIICETAMGIKIHSQINAKCDYVDAIHRIKTNFMKRILRPWHWNDFIYRTFSSEGQTNEIDIKYVHDYTMKVIKERKKYHMESGGKKFQDTAVSDDLSMRKKRLAFIDILIEQHLAQPSEFTELNIREEVDTFMSAGHDTTAMSMIWTLYLLGSHPEIQDRVHAEIDSVFQDDQQGWSMTQLREFKFLEACIKESLRLFPSIPFIGRRATEDIQFEDRTIPKNCTIFLFIHGIQRDAQYFPKPNHFQPDRFMDHGSSVQKINPFAFVPFSAGPRNCIGQKFALQEEKVVLATVLRYFRVESTQPLDAILINPELILRPKVPVWIRFVPRCDQT